MYIDNDDTDESRQDVAVDPDKLDRQAEEFSHLGNNLHDRLGQAEVQRLRLGTAPPAQWFAARLAQLTGPGGTPEALRQWANGLVQLGEDERATASGYRITDDANGVTFHHLGSALDGDR
jgi:hypothetical protein